MRFRTWRVPRVTAGSGFTALILFAVVFVIVCVEVLGVRGAARAATITPPITGVLRRHQYASFEQYHDDVLLGQGSGELRFTASPNRFYFSYGNIWSECTYGEVVLEGNAARYSAKPVAEDATWKAYIRRPLNQSEDGAVGLWVFCITRDVDGPVKTDDTDQWSASEWVMLNADGSAVWGSGPYDALSYDEQNLPPDGQACTWRTAPCDSGTFVILDLTEGYSVIEIKTP